MKLTAAAVLSPTIADLGRPLAARLGRQIDDHRHQFLGLLSAVGEDWNTYLKPRPVIRSE